MSDKIPRREFFQRAAQLAAAGLVGGLIGCKREAQETTSVPTPSASGPQKPAAAAKLEGKVGKNRWVGHPTDVELAVATGDRSPEDLVKAAVAAYGGISAFVRPGDTVVIKPNLAWGRTPDEAANTNPLVLAAVIGLCREAKAGEILVMDHTCKPAIITFDISGASAVCQEAAVDLIDLNNEALYDEVEYTRGVNVKKDQVATEILECDCLINVPIMKHHSGAEICGGMKNLMGCIWYPQSYHQKKSQEEKDENLQQCIADLSTGVRPTVNIMDAINCLVTNGPQGPGDVQQKNTIMVSSDIVALDAMGARLIGIDPQKVGHVRLGAELELKIKRVTV